MSVRLTARSATFFLAGAVVAAPFAARPAVAQTAAPGKATPASTAAARDATVDRRITTLHTQLKITPAQEKTFDAFASVMRQNASHIDALVQKRLALPASATAVDELQAYNDMAQAHAQDMQQLVAAFSTLYDALSPEQKKMADEDFHRYGTDQRPPRT